MPDFVLMMGQNDIKAGQDKIVKNLISRLAWKI